MPWEGWQLQNRDVVDLVASYWPNQKVKAAASIRAESRNFIGARHVYDDGREDVGLGQHALSAAQVGTNFYHSIVTDSKDPAVYMPVARANVKLMAEKWNYPLYRIAEDGHKYLDKYRWLHWVAYKDGWATLPHAYVWKHALDGDGNLTISVGPWVPTGRFLYYAIQGVANWWHFNRQEMNESESLREAERLADQWGITDSELARDDRRGVYWIFPKTPTEPPADGRGPRPVPNNGF